MEKIFNQIHEDVSQNPPKLDLISKVLNDLVDGLCKFVPSKPLIHEQIRTSIIFNEVDNPRSGSSLYDNDILLYIVESLINWIEKFQAPAYDDVTKRWRSEFKQTQGVDFIVKFLREYYDHVEKMYKEVWDARKRLVDGENIIPAEHRPVVKGKNGIPDNIKSGR